MRAILLMSSLFVFAARSAAQITYDGCRDFRGRPVASIVKNDLQDVAFATWAADGSPVVFYNPNVLAWMSPATRAFFYAHECGHHALAHGARNIPLSQEQEADCFGIRELVAKGVLSRDDIPAIQRDISNSPGDWTHLPGPQRAINLAACLSGGADDTAVVACTHPAHQAGDPVPCSHPAHPGGHSGYCSHVCNWWNGPGPCHPYDVYPCTHPLHSADAVACVHAAHPGGDRVRR